jgi:drug/metabolite transporter (DMT)-like permease
VSGITGALAISLLYACLAIGPMSILSPLTAVVSAIVPLIWGVVGGEQLSPLAFAALGLALIAVVLVGFVPEKGAVRPTLRGLLMAIGSGLMIGAFLILISATPRDSGLVPLILNRTVNSVILFSTLGVFALAGHRKRRKRDALAGGSVGAATRATTQLWRPGLNLALACGVVDAAANTLILLGLRSGDLSTVAVLTAMYPAGTIILAAVVLKERIAPVQWVGLVLALTAAGLLAVA